MKKGSQNEMLHLGRSRTTTRVERLTFTTDVIHIKFIQKEWHERKYAHPRDALSQRAPPALEHEIRAAIKATIHTVVSRGAGVKFHESSAEPLSVWENRIKNPGIKGMSHTV